MYAETRAIARVLPVLLLVGINTACAARAGGGRADAGPTISAIRAGQTVRGTIERGDQTLKDGSHYDVWVYRGTAGERITVTLTSSDFDSYLTVGQRAGGEVEELGSDDDGAGGLNSQLTLELPATGEVLILANTLDADEFGSYSLELQSVAGARASAGIGSPIRAGQTVRGTIERADDTLDDGSHYDVWVYRGTAGERITVTMTSDDFDAYLKAGRWTGSEVEELGSDDDSAGGLNARMTLEVPATGEILIVANTLDADEFGSYTLELQRGT